MKTRLIVLSICFSQCFLYAQEFSTKFYLTDRNGQKDTLEVGYDANATRGVDVGYNEINFINPLNTNVFESFIIDPSLHNTNNFFLKKQILNKDSMWGALGIIVPFDSLPIKVTWNKSQFNNAERDCSFITDWTYGGWFDAGNCSFLENLKDTSNIQINKTFSNYTYNDGIRQYPFYIFYLTFADKEDIRMGVNNIQRNPDIQIYPNPASNFIFINNKSNESIKRITIFSLNGKFVEYNDESQLKINCSKWPTGLYMLKMEFNTKTTDSKIQIKR